MKYQAVVDGQQGDRELRLGNEAAVRAALEAGIGVAPATRDALLGDWGRPRYSGCSRWCSDIYVHEECGAECAGRILRVGFPYLLPLEKYGNLPLVLKSCWPSKSWSLLWKDRLKQISFHMGSTPLLGKEELLVPRVHELNVDVVARALARHCGMAEHVSVAGENRPWPSPLSARPAHCAPAAHIGGSYLAVRQAIDELGVPEPVFASDNGCYTLTCPDILFVDNRAEIHQELNLLSGLSRTHYRGEEMGSLNVLFAGVEEHGIITGVSIIAGASIDSSLNAVMSEVHGMAQAVRLGRM